MMCLSRGAISSREESITPSLDEGMKEQGLSIAIISQTLYECRWVKWLGEQFKMEALSLSVLQYFRNTRLGGKQ